MRRSLAWFQLVDFLIAMPAFYEDESKALTLIFSGKSSVKSAIYDSKPTNLKKTYAIVTEVSKHKSLLDNIINNSSFISKIKVSYNVKLCLLYDHLLGKGIRNSFRKVFQSNEEELKELCKRFKFPEKKSSSNRAPQSSNPRYIRVNTLKTTFGNVKEALLTTSDLSESEILLDSHIPNLIQLPPDAHNRLNLHDHELVKNGSILLQDKSSCFTPVALLYDFISSAPKKSNGKSNEKTAISFPFDIIDACSAPGNKTSELASLLNDIIIQVQNDEKNSSSMKKSKGSQVANKIVAIKNSKIYAFEKAEKRFQLLNQTLARTDSLKIVEPILADFLSISPDDPKFSNVQMIMVDPSCSGSGMKYFENLGSQAANNKKVSNDSANEAPKVPNAMIDRIQHLAMFQFSALMHALSFPNVKRVAYSTCSVYSEENEAVVSAVLQEFNSLQKSKHVSVELANALPTWGRRGIACHGLSEQDSQKLVRVLPEKDGMGGFFLAVFEKKASS
jgi:25S rRNA (cytosine2278-C5)-methyltransferase